MDTITYPVTFLHTYGDTVIQLQLGDVAKPEDDIGTIKPADTLSQLLDMSLGVLPIVEVVEVLCIEEEGFSEEFPEAALAWPGLAWQERQWSVHMQAAGPVFLSTQIVAFALWSNTMCPEQKNTGRSSEVKPVHNT